MAYSEISIVAPDSAPAGSLVSLEVKVKNIASPEHTIYVIPVMRIDGIVLEGSYEAITPGQIRSWYFQFTMPSSSVTVTAESWCESGYVAWHLDAIAQKIVGLATPAGPVADIIGISAPSSAPAGETVIVDVSVKNISGVDKYIGVTGVYDSTNLSWQFDYLLVSPGQTVVFRGNFTMPSKNVRVTAYSWSWDGSKWVQDDTGYVDIALAALTPEFSLFRISEYT